MADIYKKLAEHLNKTPGGFPPTESGVEIRILKQLFTIEEAELALSLILMPETAEAIATRINRGVDEIEPMLLGMGQKGLIIHQHRNGVDTFMLAQFVIGIWEYQVNRLTPELIKDFNEYVPHLSGDWFKQKTNQFRIVPVGKSVTTELNIMDYEQVEHIIRSQSKILVAPCICRKEHGMAGKGCGKLMEACLIFGSGAYMYEKRGIGRTISQEEALDIVKEAVKQGLVPEPTNAQNPANICLCCDCCCQILKNIKALDAPAKVVRSNFQARVDEEECTGCQACEEICPMDAIEMDADTITAQVNLERCIGCGLCVTACQFDAMALEDKKETEKIEPPAKLIETYMKILQEKGVL